MFHVDETQNTDGLATAIRNKVKKSHLFLPQRYDCSTRNESKYCTTKQQKHISPQTSVVTISCKSKQIVTTSKERITAEATKQPTG